MSDYIPKWHKELEIFTKIKSVIVLEGNTLDSYQYPEDGSMPKGSILRLPEYLHYYLKDMGYQNIVFYDSLRGFYNNCETDYLNSFSHLIKTAIDDALIKLDFKGKSNTSSTAVRDALAQSEEATAVIMDFASRYITSPDNMDQSEVDSFTTLLQASMEAKDVKTENGILKNILILVVNKVNDIPAWFYLQNPNLKTVTIGYPSKEERECLIKGPNFPTFFASDIYMDEGKYYQEHGDELEKIQDRFVALTEGFTFTELNGLRRLCKNEHISMKNLCDVVDLYRYGVKENPWNGLDIEEIKNAKSAFEKRVKGQDYAVTRTLDVIKRAITGLSGLQGSSHTRPKGVLFFAGPTGTGKTETAKTLAEVLFGDESCCVRFDMSEYSQGHSDQKLLGAPPGYVGYEAGGQLTNAVKKNPFSILLFDEIEKAHPSVLDKFLQILEDGRMTDGQGNTVYFSETIIIFTSNLGIYTLDKFGERVANVTSAMEYPTVASKVRAAIEDHFKLNLGRPEILNRIGENIVVFDFIRPEVAKEILHSQMNKIIDSLATQKNINIAVSDNALQALEEQVLKNLDNGGRGVGNVVENLFINTLARYLFDNEIFENADIVIDEIVAESLPAEIHCTVNKLS